MTASDTTAEREATFDAAMRVAVVGCNGFIGRALVRRIADELGPRLVLVNRNPLGPFFDRVAPEAVHSVADIREGAAAACAGADVVVDLVCNAPPRLLARADLPQVMHQAALHGRFHEMLAAAGRCHVVYVSSGGAIYGEGGPMPIAEDRAERPIGGYGLLKLYTEQGLAHVGRSSALTWTILRVANAYGPGQRVHEGQGLIPAVVDAHRSEETFSLVGDGSDVRDYVHVADIADALVRAIAAGPALAGERINIGSGVGRSTAAVLALVETLTGRPLARRRVDRPASEIGTNILDIGKARRLLGWQPRRAFETAIGALLAAPAASSSGEPRRGGPRQGEAAAARRDGPASAGDGGDRLWLFLHIPKTAGSSFRAELARRLRPQANIVVGSPSGGETYEEMRQAAAAAFVDMLRDRPVRFASGHLRWPQVAFIRDAVPQVRLLTMLRDPVARIVSAYRYMRTPAHPPHREVIAAFPTLDHFIESPAQQNQMFHFLSADAGDSLDTVFARLGQDFAFVGLTEDYELSRAVVFALVGTPPPPMLHERRTEDNPDNRVELTPERRRRIEALNPLDLELHAAWRRHFDAERPAMTELVRRAVALGDPAAADALSSGGAR